ncbi:hypothetical protein NMY22_g9260 [Coprinellus aureogranulatus]|nr:hypothetical protein NMY22_g9260 [Coprinellus aureogranulatus]
MVSSKSSSNSPNGFLEYSQMQATNSVRVDNIPDHVDRRELVALFRSLIGDVQSFRDVNEREQEQLEITFHNRATAAKALCMNGYSIGGAFLVVTAVTLSVPRPRSNPDERRNLYVLGLPFALTKNEFTAVFSRYGVVTHSVILATVDNSSRRRGFVVMSTHEEAKRALTALTRTQIKGHTIDVSWAVVQRSQGFLDGGDRALLLDSRSSHLPGPGNVDGRGYASSSSDSEYSPTMTDSAPQSGMNTPVSTTALLITNLPAMLFSQVQDLHPLLCPFGRIERIQTIQLPNAETISAIVQYGSSQSALEAKIALSGQRYDNMLLETHFVHPSFGDSGNNDLRFPSGLANDTDNRFSPRSSRAPTPMLGFGNRKGDHLPLSGHIFYGPNASHPTVDAGYSQREAFSEHTDSRAPSSTFNRSATGPSRTQAGYTQNTFQSQMNGDNGYPTYGS